MLDLIKFLSSPLLWESNENASDEDAQKARSVMDKAPEYESFFTVAETTEDIVRTIGGGDFTNVTTSKVVHAKTSTELMEVLSSLEKSKAGTGEHTHLTIVSDEALQWDTEVTLRDSQNLIVDFSRVAISTNLQDTACLKLIHCRGIRIQGLVLANGPMQSAVSLSECEDVHIVGAMFAGSQGAAIDLAGGCERVVIEACVFEQFAGLSVSVNADCKSVLFLKNKFGDNCGEVCIRLAAQMSAQGYSDTDVSSDAEAGLDRDVLSYLEPSNIFIVENTFHTLGQQNSSAVDVRGGQKINLLRNYFSGNFSRHVHFAEEVKGAVLLDNHFREAASGADSIVSFEDSFFISIVRNNFVTTKGAAIHGTGTSGGLLIGMNTLSTSASSTADCQMLLGSEKEEEGRFLMATVVKGNLFRGTSKSGLSCHLIGGKIYLFDNQLFDMRKWSFNSRVPRYDIISENNWSSVPSQNVKLSSGPPPNGATHFSA